MILRRSLLHSPADSLVRQDLHLDGVEVGGVYVFDSNIFICQSLSNLTQDVWIKLIGLWVIGPSWGINSKVIAEVVEFSFEVEVVSIGISFAIDVVGHDCFPVGLEIN